MYGDSDVMRKHAARLREQGDDIRLLADRLVAQAENVHWAGRAAEAMRERIRERASRLRDVAEHHETAAESLALHVREVDDLKDAISRTEHRADALAADDHGRAFDSRSERPPSGHKDWLSVRVPGA